MPLLKCHDVTCSDSNDTWATAGIWATEQEDTIWLLFKITLASEKNPEGMHVLQHEDRPGRRLATAGQVSGEGSWGRLAWWWQRGDKSCFLCIFKIRVKQDVLTNREVRCERKKSGTTPSFLAWATGWMKLTLRKFWKEDQELRYEHAEFEKPIKTTWRFSEVQAGDKSLLFNLVLKATRWCDVTKEAKVNSFSEKNFLSPQKHVLLVLEWRGSSKQTYNSHFQKQHP